MYVKSDHVIQHYWDDTKQVVSDRLYKGVTWSMSKLSYLMCDVKIVQNLVLIYFTFINLAGASKVKFSV